MEDLQLKGSTLKKITKPSDDPVGNADYLSLSSRIDDKEQYIKSAVFAKTNIEFTERAVEELTDILVSAKQLAIAQSSDLYNPDVRRNVAREIIQLRNQALAIANRRVGNRYLFSGYATLTRPFDENGTYKGDTGKISLEVSKDFFVPTNLHGIEVFYSDNTSVDKQVSPLAPFKQLEIKNPDQKLQENPSKIIGGRELASVDDNDLKGNYNQSTLSEAETLQTRENIFTLLNTLASSLENNNSDAIQDLLTKFDGALNRLITLRTQLGAIQNAAGNAENSVDRERISEMALKSSLADADVAELYSDIAKQQSVLQATYKSGQATLSKSLLDFLR
jgi:flagellar hook-associated protein 3 FlgL